MSTTEDEDIADLKSQRFKDIVAAGLDVAHVIHRHNIDDEQVAFQIEAAGIDTYLGLTNKVSGHDAGDYGCRYGEEIVSEYAAEPFETGDPLILIAIARSYEEEGRGVYDAVRYAWRIDVTRAEKLNLVSAHRRGLVVSAFRPTSWLEATRANFPGMDIAMPGRWGFEGESVGQATASLYIGRCVPDVYRAKEAANPVRYIEP